MSDILKLDGRTARGRQWKELNNCGKPLKQGVLEANKKCSHCALITDDDGVIVKCQSCYHDFHSPCLIKPVTNEFVLIMSENPSVFWFCPGCLSSKSAESTVCGKSSAAEGNLPSDVILQTTLMNFKRDILSLVSETIENKLNKISSLPTNNLPAEKEKPPNVSKQTALNKTVRSYANVTKEDGGDVASAFTNQKTDSVIEHKKSTAEKHIILLKPKESSVTNTDEGKKKSLHAIGNAIGTDVNVEFCSIQKSGLVAVGFSDSASKELAAQKIKESTSLSSNFETTLPRKMLPKVTINGISEILFSSCNDNKDDMKQALRNDIIKRNSFVKYVLEASSSETLEVVMLQKTISASNNVSYIAALKMTPSLRKAIFDNDDKLYVSMKRCRVHDRYYVKQCYHCQEHGHVSENCPDKANDESSTCLYCAGSHKSADCKQKLSENNHSCANCLKSKNEKIVKGARSHTAADRRCPVYQAHVRSIKLKTEDWQGNLK